MKPKFSAAYLDALFVPGKYESLAEISALLFGSEACASERHDYGFSPHLFALVESLLWFAQALRAGTWTYFEVTPQSRQRHMLATLEAIGPEGFAKQYEFGIKFWQDEVAMHDLDRWMEANDDENNRWLWRLAKEQKNSVLRAMA